MKTMPKVVFQWMFGTLKGHQPRNGRLREPIRQWLIFVAKGRCSRCGWNEKNLSTGRSPLQVDHVDGESLNCSPRNLRVLCPNCHSLTPTYGALNKSKGKKRRRYGISK